METNVNVNNPQDKGI